MFGQKPKLPVDALLGIEGEKEVADTAHEWVRNHQEYLTSVYVTARDQLQIAAARRASRYPESVSILPAGTLVLCQNHPLGCHKIQDKWHSKVYKVVKCLGKVGRVYKLKPQDGIGSEKNVHRSELRELPLGYNGTAEDLVVVNHPSVLVPSFTSQVAGKFGWRG